MSNYRANKKDLVLSETVMAPKKVVAFGRLPTVRFNILTIGEAGLGKKSFIRNLFHPYVQTDIHLASTANNKIQDTGDNGTDIEAIGKFLLPSATLQSNVHVLNYRHYGDSLLNREQTVAEIRSYLEQAHTHWSSMDTNKLTQQVQNSSAACIIHSAVVDCRIYCRGLKHIFSIAMSNDQLTKYI